MKFSIILILPLLFISMLSYSQESLSLLEIEKSLRNKYKDKVGSAISFTITYKNEGSNHISDSITIKYAQTYEKFQLYIQYNQSEHLFINDSLYSKHPNAQNTKRPYTKSNKQWVELMSYGNPYFDSKSFFKEISECKVCKNEYDENQTMILKCESLGRTEIRRVKYVISLKDTTLVEFMIEEERTNGVGSWKYDYKYRDFENQNITNSINDFFFDVSFHIPNTSRLQFPFSVNSYLPDFPYLNLNGDTIRISGGDKYILIDYWYIGCVPCAKALPYINELSVELPNVRVIGINTFQKNVVDIENYITKSDIKYQILLNKKMESSFTHPTFVVLNNNLEILLIVTGYSEGNMDMLRKYLFELPN